MNERELMARVDNVLNHKTIYYDSEEEKYEALHYSKHQQSLRRRVIEVLTNKKSRDVHKQMKIQRVSEKFGWKHKYSYDLDQADDPYMSSSEEERLVREVQFMEASYKGKLRRHRSSDDLVQTSEAAKLIKYAVPLTERDAFKPFPQYPNGLPSFLEQKAALAMVYRKRLSTGTSVSSSTFSKLAQQNNEDRICNRQGSALSKTFSSAGGGGGGKFRGFMKI